MRVDNSTGKGTSSMDKFSSKVHRMHMELGGKLVTMVTMVTIGGDLQPGCLADRLLTGLGQPQINPQAQKEKEKVYCSAEKGNHEQVGC